MRYFTAFIIVLLIAPVAGASNLKSHSFADLVEKLNPAVVNISTRTVVEPEQRENLPDEFGLRSPFKGRDPFEEFFEHFGRRMAPNRPREMRSLGSGFVVDSKGYVVTNHHVIEGADKILVTFGDDSQYEAQLIGSDKRTDIALLKIDAGLALPYVRFGNSDRSRVGDWVIAIGNPFGLGGTVTSGIISARARDINAGPYDDFIQTDAAINRGNSGGPMFNMDGEVIGINTAIFSPGNVGNVGIGFAVPSNMAAPVVEQLRKDGKVHRGWLGVRVQSLTPELAESLGLGDDTGGALIAESILGGPADQAGIRSGDVIIKFDHQDIDEMKMLPRIVAYTHIGKRVPVVVMRDGRSKTIYVKVGELQEEVVTRDGTKAHEYSKHLGMKLLKMDDAVADRYGIDFAKSGLLVVDVESGSVAARVGVRKGDVLVAVQRKKVEKIKDFEEILEKSKDGDARHMLLQFARKNGRILIAIPIKE